MLFRKLIERKSTHPTWLLAIVIFLSGFNPSFSSGYAKAEHVKAKTELVLYGKTKSKRPFSYTHSVYPSGQVATPCFNSHSVFFQNELDRVLFHVAIRTRQYFIPSLATQYILFRTPADKPIFLLG